MTDYKRELSVDKFSKPEYQTKEENDRETPQGKYADFLSFLMLPWRGWNQVSETRQITFLAIGAVAAAYKAKWELNFILSIVEHSLAAMKAVAAKEAADVLVNESPLDWAENYSSIEDAYEEKTGNLCIMLAALQQDLGEKT